MKKILAGILISAAFFAPVAFAQFNGSQGQDKLKEEIAAQVKAGKSLADIAKAALAGGVDACSLTRAMLGTGAAGEAVIAAVIGVGGNATCVINEALAAGVLPSVVRSAAIAAGVPPNSVDTLIARAVGNSPIFASPGVSGNTNNGVSAGGGGVGGGRPSGS